MSAIGCATPGGPVRLGPSRSWINAEILRSARTEYATSSSSGTMTQTIFTKLKKMNSGVVMRSSEALLDGNIGSSITQSRPDQTGERRDFFRHLIEQALDTHEPVLARYIENQLVKKLPFRPGIALRFECFRESLHPPLDVD